MRVLLDTNIVLESLCERAQVAYAQKVFEAIDNGGIEGFINSGSFNNITYIAELQLKKKGLDHTERLKTLRLILNEILNNLTIVPQENTELRKGVNDDIFKDLEDSYQYQAFISANCDYLVTLNIKDYPHNTDTRIINLVDFVEKCLTEQ